ncbi:Lrp/AsnC family transcriptional regulator [Shinella sp. CPCC 100929]|uniref:Lrp/AsnC family transcriptional regulator n=1 Tax=Shinella lacus TaxID=2654216 RepID=A0ABT1RFM9_9HYPH|nr:Lrp/AsnC family transcriptional regulator [Shinella lacus]
MDDKDRFILESLRENARISTATLGRELRVSRATIQNRIDKLVAQGVISRFTIELGDTSDETAIEALVLLKTSSVDTRPLIIKLRKIKNLVSFTSLNGDYDFALELRSKSTVELDEILAEIRSLQHVLETNCSIRLKTFL